MVVVSTEDDLTPETGSGTVEFAPNLPYISCMKEIFVVLSENNL